MTTFSFNETRYINSHIDYAYYKQHNIKFQKCFLDINNQISTNQIAKNDHIGAFLEDGTHTITIIVKDSYQNTSKLIFDVEFKNHNKVIRNFESKLPANSEDADKSMGSIKTREWTLACFRIIVVSANSTKKVDSRSKMLSAAPVIIHKS